MAISSLKQAAGEISRLQDRNQALEVEVSELRDQLALAGKKGKKLLDQTDRPDGSDQSDKP